MDYKELVKIALQYRERAYINNPYSAGYYTTKLHFIIQLQEKSGIYMGIG